MCFLFLWGWTMKRSTPNLNYARHVKKHTKEHNVPSVCVLVLMVRNKSPNNDTHAYLRKALAMFLNDLTDEPITTFPYDNNNSFEMFIKSHKKTNKKQDMKF
uniref:Uncharacterized protein n=1 Tax=Glossina austeni TaxID=7395 RepID=A0A1A9UGN0_GLOAU